MTFLPQQPWSRLLLSHRVMDLPHSDLNDVITCLCLNSRAAQGRTLKSFVSGILLTTCPKTLTHCEAKVMETKGNAHILSRNPEGFLVQTSGRKFLFPCL